MTRTFRRCPICNGSGKLLIVQTRISLLNKILGKKVPILKDKEEECKMCKGTGKLYIQIKNIWNPFRRNNNE